MQMTSERIKAINHKIPYQGDHDIMSGCFNAAMSIAVIVNALINGIGYAHAQGSKHITVYCSLLEEQCREGAAIFEKTTGIKVTMIRKSTGEVYAQVRAESSNPRGDVWWGGPGEGHLQAASEGLLS